MSAPAKAKRNRAKDRDTEFRRRYGITAADVEAMRAFQRGVCAICGRAEPLNVDHCHTTGAVRGLLCGPCNLGLGLLGDDPARILRAAEYLRESAWETLS